RFAICDRIETSLWNQNTTDFGESTGTIWHMIEHMVCNHIIEGIIGKGDRLRINRCKLEPRRILAKIPPRIIKHASRKIRERDLPIGRNAIQIYSPEQARASTQLKHTATGRNLKLVKDPTKPVPWICTEPLMQLNTSIEVSRGVILLSQEVVLINLIGHV